MTAGPYCPDEQCIEDECGPRDPCCISVCDCPMAEDACRWAGPNGDTFKDIDGTWRKVWWCGEHKNEWVE